MEDIFGFLTVSQWLAILRIGIGLWWLKSFFHKPLRKFVDGQMVDWTLALADNHPVPAYGRLIRRMVEPNRSWFPYLILLGELAVAIGMILGLSSMIIVIGQIGGPMVAGVLADLTGNYRAGFTVLAVLAGLGSLFFLLAKKPV